LASGSADYTIKLWSIESQKEVTTLQGHFESVTSIAFSPDEKYLASGSQDKTLKLWSVE
jgi:WD40 repeat protein